MASQNRTRKVCRGSGRPCPAMWKYSTLPICRVTSVTAKRGARSPKPSGTATAITMAPISVMTMTVWTTGVSGSSQLVDQTVSDQTAHRARKSSRDWAIPASTPRCSSVKSAINRAEIRVSAKTKTRSRKSSRKVARWELDAPRSSGLSVPSTIRPPSGQGCPFPPNEHVPSSRRPHLPTSQLQVRHCRRSTAVPDPWSDSAAQRDPGHSDVLSHAQRYPGALRGAEERARDGSW